MINKKLKKTLMPRDKIIYNRKTGEYSIEITPILDNPTLSIKFENRLYRLKKEMYKEYLAAIKYFYKRYYSYLTMDEDDFNLINYIEFTIDSIGKKWDEVFSGVSVSLASGSLTEIEKKKKKEYEKLNRKNPFLIDIDEEYEVNRTKLIESSIAEQVALIKSIPKQFHDKILSATMRNTAVGGNAQALYAELSKISTQADKKIKFIANDQIAKATALLDRQEAIEAGFDVAYWKKSIAGKTHRKSHADADGKEFNISKGCLIEGKYILPREEPNCKCSYTLSKNSKKQKT